MPIRALFFLVSLVVAAAPAHAEDVWVGRLEGELLAVKTRVSCKVGVQYFLDPGSKTLEIVRYFSRAQASKCPLSMPGRSVLKIARSAIFTTAETYYVDERPADVTFMVARSGRVRIDETLPGGYSLIADTAGPAIAAVADGSFEALLTRDGSDGQASCRVLATYKLNDTLLTITTQPSAEAHSTCGFKSELSEVYRVKTRIATPTQVTFIATSIRGADVRLVVMPLERGRHVTLTGKMGGMYLDAPLVGGVN